LRKEPILEARYDTNIGSEKFFSWRYYIGFWKMVLSFCPSNAKFAENL